MSTFPEKKRYEGVRFTVISVKKGWVVEMKRPQNCLLS